MFQNFLFKFILLFIFDVPNSKFDLFRNSATTTKTKTILQFLFSLSFLCSLFSLSMYIVSSKFPKKFSILYKTKKTIFYQLCPVYCKRFQINTVFLRPIDNFPLQKLSQKKAQECVHCLIDLFFPKFKTKNSKIDIEIEISI